MSDPTVELAIEIMAHHVIRVLLEWDDLRVAWDNWPEIDGYDWARIEARVTAIVGGPDARWAEAYAVLGQRADETAVAE